MPDIYNYIMISLYKDNIFKKYLIQVIWIFCGFWVLGIVAGYFAPHNLTSVAVNYVMVGSASAKIIHIADDSFAKVLLYFINNSIVALMFVIVPSIYYKQIGDNPEGKRRIEPIWISRFMIMLQTVLIAVVIGYAIPLINNNLLIVTSLLPHGIIEIPAFLIASALGAWFVAETYPRIEIGYKGLVKLFVIYVLPTLFIAAILEAYLTPYLIGLII